MSHVNIWGRIDTGSGNSEYKGPAVEMCLVCFWNIKEAAGCVRGGKGEEEEEEGSWS